MNQNWFWLAVIAVFALPRLLTTGAHERSTTAPPTVKQPERPMFAAVEPRFRVEQPKPLVPPGQVAVSTPAAVPAPVAKPTAQPPPAPTQNAEKREVLQDALKIAALIVANPAGPTTPVAARAPALMTGCAMAGGAARTAPTRSQVARGHFAHLLT